MKFTSRDQINDFWTRPNENCAIRAGGWWHHKCSYIQINKRYSGINIYLNDQWLHTTFAEMKIRPHNCRDYN